MRFKVLMVLLLLVMPCSLVQAAGNAQVDIRVVNDTIDANEAEQTLDIWAANDVICGGFQFPITLSSPDGVTWSWVTQSTGWGTSKYVTHVTGSRIDPPATKFDFMAGILVTETSLPDQIMMGTGVLFGPGMEAGELQHIISLHISVDVPDASVHQLCVTMADIPPVTYSFIDYGGMEMNSTFLDDGGDGTWYFPVIDRGLDADPGTPILPTVNSLSQNFPNPFNPGTRISFTLARKSHVKLVVYNVLAQEIKTLADNEFEAGGPYYEEWDGKDNNGHMVASGVYFYKLVTDGFSEARRMVLMK